MSLTGAWWISRRPHINGAYDEGTELAVKVRALVGKTGHKAEFNRWLDEVRIRHKPKCNFMQRLEAVKHFRTS